MAAKITPLKPRIWHLRTLASVMVQTVDVGGVFEMLAEFWSRISHEFLANVVMECFLTPVTELAVSLEELGVWCSKFGLSVIPFSLIWFPLALSARIVIGTKESWQVASCHLHIDGFALSSAVLESFLASVKMRESTFSRAGILNLVRNLISILNLKNLQLASVHHLGPTVYPCIANFCPVAKNSHAGIQQDFYVIWTIFLLLFILNIPL